MVYFKSKLGATCRYDKKCQLSCKKCEYYKKYLNTDDSGICLNTLSSYYFETIYDESCCNYLCTKDI